MNNIAIASGQHISLATSKAKPSKKKSKICELFWRIINGLKMLYKKVFYRYSKKEAKEIQEFAKRVQHLKRLTKRQENLHITQKKMEMTLASKGSYIALSPKEISGKPGMQNLLLFGREFSHEFVSAYYERDLKSYVDALEVAKEPLSTLTKLITDQTVLAFSSLKTKIVTQFTNPSPPSSLAQQLLGWLTTGCTKNFQKETVETLQDEHPTVKNTLISSIAEGLFNGKFDFPTESRETIIPKIIDRLIKRKSQEIQSSIEGSLEGDVSEKITTLIQQNTLQATDCALQRIITLLEEANCQEWFDASAKHLLDHLQATIEGEKGITLGREKLTHAKSFPENPSSQQTEKTVEESGGKDKYLELRFLDAFKEKNGLHPAIGKEGYVVEGENAGLTHENAYIKEIADSLFELIFPSFGEENPLESIWKKLLLPQQLRSFIDLHPRVKESVFNEIKELIKKEIIKKIMKNLVSLFTEPDSLVDITGGSILPSLNKLLTERIFHSVFHNELQTIAPKIAEVINGNQTEKEALGAISQHVFTRTLKATSNLSDKENISEAFGRNVCAVILSEYYSIIRSKSKGKPVASKKVIEIIKLAENREVEEDTTVYPEIARAAIFRLGNYGAKTEKGYNLKETSINRSIFSALESPRKDIDWLIGNGIDAARKKFLGNNVKKTMQTILCGTSKPTTDQIKQSKTAFEREIRKTAQLVNTLIQTSEASKSDEPLAKQVFSWIKSTTVSYMTTPEHVEKVAHRIFNKSFSRELPNKNLVLNILSSTVEFLQQADTRIKTRQVKEITSSS